VLAAEGGLDLQTHREEDLGHFRAGGAQGCQGVPRGRTGTTTWLWQEWSQLIEGFTIISGQKRK